MKNKNFYALVESRLPRDLNGTCIETQDGLVYSWRDLHFASARIAGWLASLNLAPGEDGAPPRVAVQVEKSPEALMLYLATLRAGLAYVPLNTAYQRAEIDYFLRDAQPAVFVCTPQRAADLRPLAEAAGVAHVMTLGEGRDGTLLEAAAPFADGFATAQRRADDLAAILYTSGTTGRSKGAMLSHGNLASNALVLDDFWGFKEEREAGDQDVLLHALPLFHVHGLFVASHAALLAGAKMIFLPRFDAREVLRRLPQSTVMMGVPTYYVRLLAEEKLDRHSCRNLRLFISGSAPLLTETFTDFQKRSGHTIVERYGMSETLMLTSNPYFGIAARERIEVPGHFWTPGQNFDRTDTANGGGNIFTSYTVHSASSGSHSTPFALTINKACALDSASWTSSVGRVDALNGWDDGAPHEARERDYFFALGFWSWGLLAGAGVASVAAALRRRVPAPVAILPLAAALVPLLANRDVADRRREPVAGLPRTYARLLLESVPPNGVLVAAGDNDTFPLWYLQQVEEVRPDVSIVTAPLLGAPWYRSALAADGLLGNDLVSSWRGMGPVLGSVMTMARAKGRAVRVSALLTKAERLPLDSGAGWVLEGLVYRPSPDVAPGSTGLDLVALRRAAAEVPRSALTALPPASDPAAETAQQLLRCTQVTTLADSLLVSGCNGL